MMDRINKLYQTCFHENHSSFLLLGAGCRAYVRFDQKDEGGAGSAV